ncbi:ubiquitin-specific protease [Martiniozyma asiatica (nom. inval.)]|nr:ubiquitin-specific protease [Martiniozyma asiatica]
MDLSGHNQSNQNCEPEQSTPDILDISEPMDTPKIPRIGDDILDPFVISDSESLDDFKYNVENVQFKTIERILDDLRLDPLFLQHGQKGILSLPTYKYADSVSPLIRQLVASDKFGNHSKGLYSTHYYDNITNNLESMSVENLDNNSQLYSVIGLVTPIGARNEFLQGKPLSDIKLYHYKIKIKVKSNRQNIDTKHCFHMLADDELTRADQNDLIINKEKLLESSGKFEIDNDQLELVLPKILDSANYVSTESDIIMRVELYSSMFSAQNLETFSLSEASMRIALHNSNAETNNRVQFDQTVDTLKCLHKLSGCLKGPLVNNDPNKHRAIDLRQTNIDVILDLNFLKSHLLFKQENENLLPTYPYEWHDKQKLLKDFYYRAYTESQFYISIHENSNKLMSGMDHVFDLIADSDYRIQKSQWNKWNEDFYISGSILLSCVPYYSSENIMDICYKYILLPTIYQPLYMDGLISISQNIKNNYQRSDFQSNIQSLMSTSGIYPLNDIKKSFDNLSIQFSSNIEDMAQWCKKQSAILEFYFNVSVVKTSKYERASLRHDLEKIANWLESCHNVLSRNDDEMLDVSNESNYLIKYLQIEPFSSLIDAIHLLAGTNDVSTSVSSDVLIALTTDLASSPDRKRAVMTIAAFRRNVSLMTMIRSSFNELDNWFKPHISLHDALEQIGLLNTASDETIIRVWQANVSQITNLGGEPDESASVSFNDIYIPLNSIRQYLKLYYALVVIAESRNSLLIFGFLESGIVKSDLLPIDRMPAGLRNIGNTCYLNSLIQYLFALKPIRDWVTNSPDGNKSIEFSGSIIKHPLDCVDIPNSFYPLPNILDKSIVKNIEMSDILSQRRIGHRQVGANEITRSLLFTEEIGNLFKQMMGNDRIVTPGKKVAYLAMMDISQNIEFLNNEIKDNFSIENNKNDDDDGNVNYGPKNIDESVENKENDVIMNTNDSKVEIVSSTSDENSVIDVTEKDAHMAVDGSMENLTSLTDLEMNRIFDVGEQQDVMECISNVFGQLEISMEPEALEDNNCQMDMIRRLFYGKIKRRIVSPDHDVTDSLHEVKGQEEDFLNTMVSVTENPKNLYEALDSFYFSDDVFETQNGPSRQLNTITKLPIIFQVQVQRIDYSQGYPVKISRALPFDETIYLDRYVESKDPDLLERRKQFLKVKSEILSLRSRKAQLSKTNNGLTYKQSLITTKQWLESENFKQFNLPTDDNLLEVINLEISKLEEETSFLNDQIPKLEESISSLFDVSTTMSGRSYKNYAYKAFAMFIHKGNAGGGHYWAYIRDTQQNLWRMYNDETIMEVQKENLFDDKDATPYALMFVREDLEKEVVEALKRGVNENLDLINLD